MSRRRPTGDAPAADARPPRTPAQADADARRLTASGFVQRAADGCSVWINKPVTGWVRCKAHAARDRGHR
jgi:hypothetical protein